MHTSKLRHFTDVYDNIFFLWLGEVKDLSNHEFSTMNKENVPLLSTLAVFIKRGYLEWSDENLSTIDKMVAHTHKLRVTARGQNLVTLGKI